MNSGQRMNFSHGSLELPVTKCDTTSQEGWALLGLMLALAILSIVLVSSITPNYQITVQREKETEMLYRGQQMAEGIARYYNYGNLGVINLQIPPSYGYLKELKKLSEGVKIGVRDIKFVRPSAMTDPMTSDEWEPVFARDPRILPFLQAWAAETGGVIPPSYLLLASAPIKTHKIGLPSTQPSETTPQQGAPAGNPGQAGGIAKKPFNGDDDGSPP